MRREPNTKKDESEVTGDGADKGEHADDDDANLRLQVRARIALSAGCSPFQAAEVLTKKNEYF